MAIGRLKPVPLRELWPNEAYDFTTWLAKNLDLVSEALGMDLSLLEQEASAGTFSADILAEDASGDTVVIENQLERTDHDHLGKLITYLSNLDARAAIWITSEPRPEHEKAIHWLNEMLPADTAFYLVRIEAYRIEDSPRAPLLTVIAGPSPEARQIGDKRKELAERHVKKREFWRRLLERADRRTSLYSQRSPTTESWLNAGAGKKGIAFQFRVRMHDASVGLRIRWDTPEESKRIFDALHARKETIEQKFGRRLEWKPREDLKMCQIVHTIDGGGWKDQELWPEIQEEMVDAMVRLEQALGPEIDRLS
ncbi:MAG: DUF4268 domain-containing protein [Chloroflexota bacterium]|nr:DUF4268 domain-containing protein [Chloroflexota bacterium]